MKTSSHIKTKIILQTKLRKLGNIGDVLLVARGFARNYLFPTGQAILATDEALKDIERMKESIEKRNLNKLIEIREFMGLINDKYITINTRADSNGILYGAISKQDIVNQLTLEYPQILFHKKMIELPVKDLKLLGEYRIQVRFLEDNSAFFNLIVERV